MLSEEQLVGPSRTSPTLLDGTKQPLTSPPLDGSPRRATQPPAIERTRSDLETSPTAVHRRVQTPPLDLSLPRQTAAAVVPLDEVEPGAAASITVGTGTGAPAGDAATGCAVALAPSAAHADRRAAAGCTATRIRTAALSPVAAAAAALLLGAVVVVLPIAEGC